MHVSVRTIKYWMKNGKLKPVQIGSNGYNYFSDEQLLQLQKGMQKDENCTPLDEGMQTYANEPMQKGMQKDVCKKVCKKMKIAHLWTKV